MAVGPLRTAGALVALLAGLLPGTVFAQSSVVGSTLEARVDPSGETRVSLTVLVEGVAAGDSVPVTLLDFGQASAEDLRAGPDQAGVTLPVRTGAARRGYLTVEEGDGGRGRLSVSYRVSAPGETGTDVRIHVPVLTVDLPPREAQPGLFRATVVVPDGWVVTEGFPTTLAAGGGPELGVELQVVPSLVSLRARRDGRWGLGLPLLLDVVAVAGLLSFSVAGWRHLTAEDA